MKKATVILFVFVFTNCVAQQKPHYTQYVLNNYILNPALSGIENYTDVKLSARDQWVGLSGAPKTFYFTAHTPIGKKDYKTSTTSFNIPGQNPRGNSYWENYTASEPHHGIGVAIINDQTGNYSRFTADAAYAYHLGLSARTNVAMGFSGGFSKIGYDGSKALPSNPADPALGTGSNSLFKISPDLNAGIWLYSANYFVGVSAQQVIPQKVDFVGNNTGIRLLPHLFSTAGVRFLLNEDVNAIPSVMVKYVSGAPVGFDANIKLQYQDLLWAGGSYRFGNGYSAMLGLNVANTFNVGYAYDFTTTELNTASRGTHELIIGFLIGNRYGDTCPRNIW